MDVTDFLVKYRRDAGRFQRPGQDAALPAVAESQKLHEEPLVAHLPLSVSNSSLFPDVELLCHHLSLKAILDWPNRQRLHPLVRTATRLA